MPNWRTIEGGRWLRTFALSITDILKLEQVHVKEICPFVAVTCLEVKHWRVFWCDLGSDPCEGAKICTQDWPYDNGSLCLRAEFRLPHRV